MSLPLEDYALIGDSYTAALVSRGGSIDWLCLPDFDSVACFAALLGRPEHGHWSISPRDADSACTRRYRPDSLVLESSFDTADGSARIVDCMPIRDDGPDIVRRVEGVRGRVAMRSDFVPRLDYGEVVPWMRIDGRRLQAIAGPNLLTLDSDVPFELTKRAHAQAEFTVQPGTAVNFRLSWCASHQQPARRPDPGTAIHDTEEWWRSWTGRSSYTGDYRDPVVRSLITLKALTYAPTGGIVAAPTTSLPELLGGVRNWDYRFCWIRDATFTLLVLLDAGYVEEARAWREWLLRAVAGQPEQMQIMYGIDGRRRLTEIELPWLPGYAESTPVRVGNQAARQFQLDVYGELMDALHQARAHGIPPDPDAWRVQRELMDFLEGSWQEPDNGIWEVRGPRRHFTHSKVLAWVAADRAVKAVENFGLDGPAGRWKALRKQIFDEVCAHGYDAERGTFTQYYGSQALDASLLTMPHVGFLPATDERVRGTTAAVERELVREGFVQRYTMSSQTESVDGLPHGEGAFLPCTFWLADNYILQGDVAKGQWLFERLLELRNDVGLLAEEYDPVAGRLVGNYPQALSHIPLVDTAFSLAKAAGPVQRRAETGEYGRADEPSR